MVSDYFMFKNKRKLVKLLVPFYMQYMSPLLWQN